MHFLLNVYFLSDLKAFNKSWLDKICLYISVHDNEIVFLIQLIEVQLSYNSLYH